MPLSTYDFIVVGGGAAGCVIASRLANSSSHPSVLLLEAGGDNTDSAYRVSGERFSLAFTEPKLNWGYKTTPQKQLSGQQIDYSRGRGLGGSTAINFACWIIGADEDFNRWAELVGDSAWEWENVKERFKKIENYHPSVPEKHRKYINPQAEDHGTKGPLDLSYSDVWELNIEAAFQGAEEIGLGTNPDVNSGNPIGMGMGPSTAYKGERTTASSYLTNPPSNLTIILNSPTAKVITSGKNATGVQTTDGRSFYASKDVILSAGSLNSPQILMLSGIGPEDELAKHNIPLVHSLPEVGQNLQDHCFSTAVLIQKPGTNERMAYESDAKAIEAAKAQYAKDKTGKLAELYCGVPMGWFKSDAVYASPEFAALSPDLQEYLRRPTVPSYEIATNTPPLYLGDHTLTPTESYLCALGFVMNPQSRGTVSLASADPTDGPLIDPNFLSHPFDKRVAIEAYRSVMNYLEAPVFKETAVRMVGCAKSKSDEDIWAHVSANLMSSWHMCSTVIMGACVDTSFRVHGVSNLRVVDLSVIPFVPNNHTQSTAYLVGETAAEKIIAEYGLDVTESIL